MIDVNQLFVIPRILVGMLTMKDTSSSTLTIIIIGSYPDKIRGLYLVFGILLRI